MEAQSPQEFLSLFDYRLKSRKQLEDRLADGVRTLPYYFRPAHRAQLGLFAKAVEATSDGADLILITGDLAHCGERRHLGAAEAFVRELETVKRALRMKSSPKDKLVLLPGNHDRYEDRGFLPFVPGGTLFDSVFNSRWGGTQRNPTRAIVESASLKLGVVCADFSLREAAAGEPVNPASWPGQGAVHEDLLGKIAAATQELQAEGIPVVWAIHFAPQFEGLNVGLEFVEGEKLIALAQADGLSVSHIFCGHTHQARRYRIRGGPEIVCAGSATAEPGDGRRSFYLLELRHGNQGLETASCWQYSSAVGNSIDVFEGKPAPPVVELE